MANTQKDEFAPQNGDIVFSPEEQAIIDEAVQKSIDAAWEEYEKIEKTW